MTLDVLDGDNKNKFGARWIKKYPKNISWNTKIPAFPVYKLLDDTAREKPNNSAIDFLGKKWTYQDLSILVNKAAKGLQDLGVSKGTKVALFMPNCSYFVIMYYAILKAGGTVVNFNPLYAEKEIANQMNDASVEIMITLDLSILADKLLPMFEKTKLRQIILCSVAKSLPFFKNVLFRIFKQKEIFKYQESSRLISFDKIIDNKGDVLVPDVDPHTDIAILQYTGGTTGVPKGAMLTHANVYGNAHQAMLWFAVGEKKDEKILAALPLFHVFAMTAVMNLAVITGAEIVMMFPRFSVIEAMKLIARHKITFFPAVPTIYNMINHHPDISKFDLSSLMACLSGGASLPAEVKRKFEKLTGCKLVEAYGLSETSPAATSNPLKGENKENSIGIPFPGTFVRIVSLEDSSKEMPVGEKGQIAIKGPQVMLGYWNKLQETEAVFQDGYFLTGDVGYMDEDGYTFLVDRIKDLIICSGFNVYPRIVEEAIYTHPAVEEVTVIGIPDEKRGETVKAFIKLKEGTTCTEQEILDFLQNKLSPIEMPKFIEFKDQLPKTIIGKLSKKELVEEEKTRRDSLKHPISS